MRKGTEQKRTLLIAALHLCLELQGFAALTGPTRKKYEIDLDRLGNNLVFEGMQDRDVTLIYEQRKEG